MWLILGAGGSHMILMKEPFKNKIVCGIWFVLCCACRVPPTPTPSRRRTSWSVWPSPTDRWTGVREALFHDWMALYELELERPCSTVEWHSIENSGIKNQSVKSVSSLPSGCIGADEKSVYYIENGGIKISLCNLCLHCLLVVLGQMRSLFVCLPVCLSVCLSACFSEKERENREMLRMVIFHNV